MPLNSEKLYGPLVLGSLFASFLSGLATVQALLYFRSYSQDPKYLKTIVAIVWLLDLLHTGFTWAGMWFYVVKNFGDESKINVINHCIIGTGITTAIVTFIAQCFYVYRIIRLSNKYWLTAPIFSVVFARLCSAFVAAAVMLRITTFPAVLLHFSWVVIISLSLSCAADVLITLSMSVLLRMSRDKSLTMNHVIDLLVLYAFEMGMLTGCAAVVAMLCWVIVPNKLVFLGLYFPIGKLYANSLLGSLNARHHLRNLKNQRVSQLSGMSFGAPSIASNDTDDTTYSTFKQGDTLDYAHPLEVSVQCRKVHYDSQASNNSSPKSEVPSATEEAKAQGGSDNKT